MESLLLKKEQDLIEYKQMNMKSDTMISNMKDKIKELEDEMTKWHSFQQPKIKELELGQRTMQE